MAIPRRESTIRNQPAQRRAGRQGIDEGHPGAPLFCRAAGVAIAGQVDQPLRRGQLEEIQQPGATRGLAGAGESLALDDDVDRRRFSGIGAAHEGDLRTMVGRKLPGRSGTDQKFGPGETTHV